jgi:iron complex outermembrane recepter protein
MRSLRLWLCASAAAPCLLSTPALAADAAEADTTQIEELVVTAQKRSENLQDVPAAISAVSGAELSERGITTPQDLQFITPSMLSGRLL